MLTLRTIALGFMSGVWPAFLASTAGVIGIERFYAFCAELGALYDLAVMGTALHLRLRGGFDLRLRCRRYDDRFWLGLEVFAHRIFRHTSFEIYTPLAAPWDVDDHWSQKSPYIHSCFPFIFLRSTDTAGSNYCCCTSTDFYARSRWPRLWPCAGFRKPPGASSLQDGRHPARIARSG